jgi:serine/threonine-protein kinase
MAVAVARLFAPPPDARALRPELLDAAAELVLQLMALEPHQRPASADEVARSLAELPVTTASRRPLSDLGGPGGGGAASLTSTRGTMSPGSGEVTSRPGLPGGSLAESTPGEHHLAVLPFRNAGDPSDDHWADGFTDDLIETLSLLPRLKVRSRGAVLKFKGSLDPREVGRELAVQSVVEGSVRRAPGMLRVTTRLVSVADGFQIWARRFDRPDGDLLAIADDVAQAIAEALVKPIALPARSDLNDPVALDLYLRARKQLRIFHREGAVQAAELVEQALARVPDDPRLLAAQAIARARMWVLEADGNRSYEIAMTAATRAKQLAPELAEASTAMAVMLMTEMRVLDAAPELRAALKRGPMLAEPRELAGRLLIELDRIDEGIAELERALTLEPGITNCEVELARANALRGDWDRAWALIGGDSFAHVTARARLLLWSDRLEETLALVDREEKRYPMVARFRILTIDGPAPGPTTQVGPRRARRDLFFMQLNTEIAAARHDHELAMTAFGRAVDAGLFDLSWTDRCPILGALRQDPRFMALRQRVVARANAISSALLG